MPLQQQLGKFSASAIPFIIAPTGTMANNGAITLGTALPNLFVAAYVYLPANAVVAGSAAGWYFAQFTSTTAGTVYNNTYVSGQPQVPAALTPFVTSGPGAYTGVTTAVIGPQIQLDPNTVGANGFIRATAMWSAPNNANSKTAGLALGGSIFFSGGLASSGALQYQTIVFNRGMGSQAGAVPIVAMSGNGSGLGNSPGPIAYGNYVEGSTPGPFLQVTGQLAVATDYIIIEAFLFEFAYGA